MIAKRSHALSQANELVAEQRTDDQVNGSRAQRRDTTPCDECHGLSGRQRSDSRAERRNRDPRAEWYGDACSQKHGNDH